MDFVQSRRYLDTLPDWETGSPDVGPLDAYLPRMRALLRRLDDPQRAYRSVIVGGTNGKGTTGSFLSALIDASGARSGFYSSPHLHSVRERIRISGLPADKDAWADGVSCIRDVGVGFESEGYGGFTKFEALTALSALLFRDVGIDVGVFEVGLGGRYDATNAWDHDAAVLTSVALDHTDVLGDTVEVIARDKLHIARSGRPLFVPANQEDVVRGLVTEVGRRGVDVRWVDVESDEWGGTCHRPKTFLQNVRLAQAAAEAVVTLGPSAFEETLRTHTWPGRFEVVSESPGLVLDGAHNPAAAERLREDLAAIGPRWAFVIAGAKGHDIQGVIRALAPIASRFWMTRSDHPKALPASDLIHAAEGVPCQLLEPSVELLRRCLASREEPVCVTGTLSLVAQARRALGLPAEMDGITEEVLLESLRCLTNAADAEGLTLEQSSDDGNVLSIRGAGGLLYFLRNKHPFNDYVSARLAEDKAYQYELFVKAGIPVPLSLKVFNPLADERFHRYRTHNSLRDVVTDVEARFSYPVVVKRNHGSVAYGVYLETDRSGLERRLQFLFETSGLLQNIVLVQAFVEGPEYRVVANEGDLLLAYEKQGPLDEKDGDDLNPLHRVGGRAVRVDDPILLKVLAEIAESIGETLRLGFYAIDLIDGPNGPSVLEVNPNPFCYYYNASYGRSDFEDIYRRLLRRYVMGVPRGVG